jgi:Cytidylate kinase-like family
MPIIAISRASFSGGQSLAERVAERLAYRCLGREVLVGAAATCGVPEPALAQFLDTSPGLWERLTQSRRLDPIYARAVMSCSSWPGTRNITRPPARRKRSRTCP